MSHDEIDQYYDKYFKEHSDAKIETAKFISSDEEEKEPGCIARMIQLSLVLVIVILAV